MSWIKRVGRDTLGWFGILNLAVAVLGALEPLVSLSRWAKALTEAWVEIAANVWVKLFLFFGLKLPPLMGFALSLAVFNLALGASSSNMASSIWRRLLSWSRKASDYDALPMEYSKQQQWLVCAILYIPILTSVLTRALSDLVGKVSIYSQPASFAPEWPAIPIVLFSIVGGGALAWPPYLARRLLNVYICVIVLFLLSASSSYLEAISSG